MVIQLSEREEAKALLILLRHSRGVVLPNRVYVLSQLVIEGPRAGVVLELSATAQGAGMRR